MYVWWGITVDGGVPAWVVWTGCFKTLFAVIIVKRLHPWNKKNWVYIKPTDDYWFYYSHDLCGCSTDVWQIQGEMHC